MKKIITAMGNNRLANELQKTGQFEIVTKDIPYREGIIEVLEENSNIDILIISEILDGELSFEDVINLILSINEKIEIIVFVEEKTPDIQSLLFSNGIYKIYQNNEIDIDTFIESIGGKRETAEEIANTYLENCAPKCDVSFDMSKFDERGNVISIVGSYNSGKSTLACVLAKQYANEGDRTLLIDFDVYNSSINTLLEIQKYNNKDGAFNLESQTMHISKNEDVICSMDLLFNNNNTIDYINLEQMIKDFKKKYDTIIIDTTSDHNYKYLQRLLDISDEIIFLSIPSRVELRKTFNLYEVLVVDFKIDRKKIKIVLNKVTKESVDKNVISKMLGNKEISGIVDFDEKIEKNINNKFVKSGGIKWKQN